MTNKNYLIIVPSGDNSLHKNWYNSKIYDLYVIYYGNNKNIFNEYKKKADFFRAEKGPKWQQVRNTLKHIDINKYDYIWLPDDDLYITKDDIEEFLIISNKYNLLVSQPSLNVPDIKEKDLLNEVVKFKYNLIFPKNNQYKKNDNKIVDKILNFINKENINEKTIDYSLVENLMKILYKWKNYNYHTVRESWISYFKRNNNKVNEKISKFISHKLLLQRYPKKEKIIRYCTFVEIMCPLINVNFF